MAVKLGTVLLHGGEVIMYEAGVQGLAFLN